MDEDERTERKEELRRAEGNKGKRAGRGEEIRREGGRKAREEGKGASRTNEQR